MSTRKKALLAVLAGNSIFGFSFLFSKEALAITTPSVLLAVRFLMAFFVLNGVVLFGKLTGKLSFSLKGKPLKYVLLLSVFQPVIYFCAESFGIQYTSSAFAGTIIAVIPIAGVIFDILIMHVKVSYKQILCAVVSVVGVALTAVGAQNMKSSGVGLALLLVAVVAGALFYVFSKKAGEYFNSLERTYVMFGVGSLTYVGYALIENIGKMDKIIMPALVSPAFWMCIFYLSIMSSVVAFLLLNYGSSHVSVSEGSLFANFTTVISILAGILIVHESFTWTQVVGAIFIIGSVYVSTTNGSRG